MTEGVQILTKAFQSAVQKRTTLSPAEWCQKFVRLFRSTDSGSYRPEFTPWWSEPMEEVLNNANKVICITTPVGSGKSTFIEAMTCCIQDRDPGPMLLTSQTDQDAQDWAETGLWPTLKACEPLKAKLPTQRGKWRKMECIIPRAPIHLTGANIAGLQSKSIRWAIADEAWMFKKGSLGHLLKRLHRRWNGRAIALGQAGFVEYAENEEVAGDDFTLLHHQGEQREWMFECPSCGTVQPYRLDQVVMPEEGTNAERAMAMHYECNNEQCKEQFKDDTKTRRALSDSSRFVKTREAILPGNISFHLNAFALWRSPWRDIVLEWLTVQDSMRQGLSIPLQQFTQKQMAEPWDDALTIERPNLDFLEEGKSVNDFVEGEKITGELIRFATIDVGRDHYWLGIRAWRPDGSSVGLYYSRVNTAEMLHKLCLDYKINPKCTYIDSGYEAGKVYDLCGRYGWRAIKGDGVASSFKHPIPGGTEEKIFSRARRVLSPSRKRVALYHVAVNPVKDVLARLRSGEYAAWQVPEDIGKDWVAQIDSEEREEFIHPTTKQLATRWKRVKRANHAWDCEVYQVAAAIMHRVYNQ
tara:strand:+ start:216 stop:1961 length:1746 start_codon:yes stop_codon:yes gene_type:complete